MSKELKPRFRNYYRCSVCGTEWTSAWSSTCNDHCPKCNAEIEPYSSEDIPTIPPLGVREIEIWKKNVIEVAKHHREHCHEPCNCSLFLLREMAEKVGIEFNNEEEDLFL